MIWGPKGVVHGSKMEMVPTITDTPFIPEHL